jgi:hypothetical protein
MLAVLVLLLQGATPPPPPDPAPLVQWETLRKTHYTPKEGIQWPQDVSSLDSTEVRLEGYLIMKFGAQDPGDLLLTQLHPSSLLCGPTDMTAFVEIYLADFEFDTWPTLPVEVTGSFTLSRSPDDMHYIYRVTGNGWRELRRWEQEFPGALEESEGNDPDDRP